MAYKPQYCAGQTVVGANRRKQMDPNHKLAKLRDVTDKDIVLIMGHRAPGSAYKSAHPPLSEQQEPACPVRKMVTPTDGAKAGDREGKNPAENPLVHVAFSLFAGVVPGVARAVSEPAPPTRRRHVCSCTRNAQTARFIVRIPQKIILPFPVAPSKSRVTV